MCWMWNRRKTDEMLAWAGRRTAFSVTDQGDSQGQELGSEMMAACQGTDGEGAVDTVSREVLVSGAGPVSLVVLESALWVLSLTSYRRLLTSRVTAAQAYYVLNSFYICVWCVSEM